MESWARLWIMLWNLVRLTWKKNLKKSKKIEIEITPFPTPLVVWRYYSIKYLACLISVSLFFPECQNYQSLTAADRKITYTTYHGYCDNSITEGWYRFEAAAGTRMPTSCMPSGNRCGTHVIGWLTNGHPRVADGRVKKQVCFSYNGQCCFSNFSKNIYVTNCGSYYVYQLVRPGNCYYRYCGTD